MKKLQILLIVIVFTFIGAGYALSSSYSNINTVKFTIQNNIYVNGNTSSIEFKMLIPQTIPHEQTITNLTFNPAPQYIDTRENNKYAIYSFSYPKKSFSINISGQATIHSNDIKSKKDKTSYIKTSIDDNPDFYLQPEKFVESNSFKIKQIASNINGASDLETLYNIYSFVIDELEYGGYNAKDYGALEALSRKKVDCNEYVDLLVAICRAKGIPAKATYGFTTKYYITPKHVWAEVYTKQYGWIRLDPTFDDTGSTTFQKLKPIYIALSSLRIDSFLNDYYYYSYLYKGDPIKVEEKFYVY